MNKKFLRVFLALAMILSLAACGNKQPTGTPAEGGGTPKAEICSVGIVVKSLDNDYYMMLKAGAEAEAAAKGVDLTFVAPNAETDIQGQVDMISNLIAAQVDVLCVCPSDDAATLPIISEAGKAGISVLAVDNDTSYEGKLTYIGTGNYDAAYAGGEYCAKQAGTGANAIVLRGPEGSSNHDQRQDGFVAALEAGGVTILEIKPADCVAATAMSVIEDLMTVYDDIDLIICTNDSMAIGAQRAVEAAGLKCGVFGFDGSADVCQGTADGIYLGTVAQDPYRMGVLAIDNAIAVFNGEKIEPRIDSGCTVVNADNAAEFLKK